MYWFLSFSFLDIFLWLLSMALLTFGGWLLATHLFCLENEERVLVGFGLGLTSYLWLVNLLGHWLPSFIVFFGCSILVALLGLCASFRSPKPFLHVKDWKIGVWLVSGLALGWMFLRVSKGTALYDEYKNLALISTMATGWLPPLSHFGYSQLLRYHYGFHLFGAAMMELAHFMPWSAWDLSKSIVWSCSILLTALVGKRFLKSNMGGILLAAVMSFATGTRYLLLLLPSGIFNKLKDVIPVANFPQGVTTFTQGLSSFKPLDGGPPFPYPFAFQNGISQPYMLAHSGEPTIELMLLALTLLLLGRAARCTSLWVYAVFFSFAALANESYYGLMALGGAVFVLWQIARRIPFQQWDEQFRLASLGFIFSIPVVALQGGTVTAILQTALIPSVRSSLAHAPLTGFLGFSLRWPPAVVTVGLGTLSLASPLQTLVALFELGPVIFFLPWLTIQLLKKDAQESWALRILLFSAWVGLLLPLFISWGTEQDITHITAVGLQFTFLLLTLKLVEMTHQEVRKPPAYALGILALALSCVGGIVLGSVQLTAAPNTVFTTGHYFDTDAQFAQKIWGHLPHESKILGPIGKASILTGQLTGGILDYPAGAEQSVWTTLMKEPTLDTLLSYHFDFVFVDARWWKTLNDNSKHELQSHCITVYTQAIDRASGRFTRLLDLRGCYPLNKP